MIYSSLISVVSKLQMPNAKMEKQEFGEYLHITSAQEEMGVQKLKKMIAHKRNDTLENVQMGGDQNAENFAYVM